MATTTSFQINALSLCTILAMALVTYLTRVSGWWLMSRLKPSPRLDAWLRHLPGGVLVSMAVPAALANGPADALASVVTLLIAARTQNLLLSIVAGVGAAWLLRGMFGS